MMKVEPRSEQQRRNIELVTSWLDLWEQQGPAGAIAQVEAFIHPESEWIPGGVTLGREMHRGRAELVEYMELTAKTTREVTITRLEVRPVGEDGVLVLGRLRYAGKDESEDPRLNGEYALLFRIEDGLIRTSQSYLSHAAAEGAAAGRA